MRGLKIVGMCLLLFVVGCSQGGDKWKDKRPKTVKAAGMLFLEGKPLEGAQVVLVGGQGGSGLSGADGSFRLSTFPPDEGVVPGAYKVMIVKSAVPQNPEPGSEESSTPQYAKLLVPAKYTDPETSGISVEIPEAGKEDLKLELKE